jgi:hypothetical protein
MSLQDPIKRAQLQALRASIEYPNPDDDQTFQAVVTTALDEGILKAYEVAECTDCWPERVMRWALGEELPSSHIRLIVFGLFKVALDIIEANNYQLPKPQE